MLLKPNPSKAVATVIKKKTRKSGRAQRGANHLKRDGEYKK